MLVKEKIRAWIGNESSSDSLCLLKIHIFQFCEILLFNTSLFDKAFW